MMHCTLFTFRTVFQLSVVKPHFAFTLICITKAKVHDCITGNHCDNRQSLKTQCHKPIKTLSKKIWLQWTCETWESICKRVTIYMSLLIGWKSCSTDKQHQSKYEFLLIILSENHFKCLLAKYNKTLTPWRWYRARFDVSTCSWNGYNSYCVLLYILWIESALLFRSQHAFTVQILEWKKEWCLFRI